MNAATAIQKFFLAAEEAKEIAEELPYDHDKSIFVWFNGKEALWGEEVPDNAIFSFPLITVVELLDSEREELNESLTEFLTKHSSTNQPA